MVSVFAELSAQALATAGLVTLGASFVKGAVGFAMPMLMISGLASFLDVQTALAVLILPTLYTNLLQAFRGGARAAWAAARTHWRYLLIVVVMIALSAQFVRAIPQAAMLIVLGAVVACFAVTMLAGWQPRIGEQNRRAAEIGLGAFAGTVGGLSGVWGPQTVMYLTALDVPKVAMVRAQGVIYGAGAVMLVAAHLHSGVLNAATVPLGLAALPLCTMGMWLGFKVQDRLDQNRFRQATLAVLVLAGLNLIRRGLSLG